MKATELIKEVQKLIDKHGEDLEVYSEINQRGSSDTHKVEYVGNYVWVDNLDEYDDKMIYEEHGGNTGLIYCINIEPGEYVCTND
jgi:putative methionine-R-sulfoxide reductase with GAF domain